MRKRNQKKLKESKENSLKKFKIKFEESLLFLGVSFDLFFCVYLVGETKSQFTIKKRILTVISVIEGSSEFRGRLMKSDFNLIINEEDDYPIQ